MQTPAVTYSLKQVTLMIFIIFSHSASIGASTVKMDVAIGNQSTDTIYIELYDNVAPNTVQNFISYVSSGDYVNSLIHRSVPGFIVQGGGFTYNPEFDSDARFFSAFGPTNLVEFADPVTGELGVRPIGETYLVDANNDDIPDVDVNGNVISRVNDGLNTITQRGPILNEFNLSNIRGTIGMAKLSGDPDSATSQWFVNLADNSANLDFQNGGFTVFGQVLGNGMDFFDAVSNLDIYSIAANIHPELGSLPVVNYDLFTLILEENVVRVTNVEVVNTVPIPAAVWLFGSGLIGLIGVARRESNV